ncbi:AraC family transcriptional regulator [Acidocella sp.]|jgi:AraC-like DNA-binding protein|uniref:AraC family transcriptional regulator n=1 Tax=Acidocella sp. TaxID=50710 RepID=UPI002F427A54
MSYSNTLAGSFPQFDPDASVEPVVALRVNLAGAESEQPIHQHRKGQLILALHGNVTCRVSDALLVVLPGASVWIPGGIPHSNQASPNAKIIFLFAEPEALMLPQRCCILSISPLVREMIIYLADERDSFPNATRYSQFCEILLDQLARTPVERLSLPLSSHPKLRSVCDMLIENPGDRRSRAEWASTVAMSERTFDRLVMKETGQPFGRWRQQLQLIIALRNLSGGATVQQVALELGYESTTAFIIMFKKAFGMPPGQYISGQRPLLSLHGGPKS